MSNDVSNKKQQPFIKTAPVQLSPGMDFNRAAIKHLFFVDAFDLPGTQVSNVECVNEILKVGRSYVCTLVKDESAFELVCGNAGVVQLTAMIPMARVKSYRKA